MQRLIQTVKMMTMMLKTTLTRLKTKSMMMPIMRKEMKNIMMLMMTKIKWLK